MISNLIVSFLVILTRTLSIIDVMKTLCISVQKLQPKSLHKVYHFSTLSTSKQLIYKESARVRMCECVCVCMLINARAHIDQDKGIATYMALTKAGLAYTRKERQHRKVLLKNLQF